MRSGEKGDLPFDMRRTTARAKARSTGHGPHRTLEAAAWGLAPAGDSAPSPPGRVPAASSVSVVGVVSVVGSPVGPADVVGADVGLADVGDCDGVAAAADPAGAAVLPLLEPLPLDELLLRARELVLLHDDWERAAGFRVEKRPGPIGKREMFVAIKEC